MGQVRIPVTVDKAEEALRELRKLSGGIKSMGDDAKRSASALEQIQKSYTGLRRGVETFNQMRGVISTFTNTIRSAVQMIGDLAERTPRTRTALESLKTATGRVADEFVRGLDSGGAFAIMLQGITGSMGGAEDAARSAGDAIRNFLNIAGGTGRVAAGIQTAGLTELARLLGGSAAGAERSLVGGTAMAFGVSGQGLAYTPPDENIPRPGSTGDHGRGVSRWGDTQEQRRGGGGGGGSDRRAAMEAEAARWQAAKELERLETERAITEQYDTRLGLLREQLHYMDLQNESAQEQQRIQSEWVEAIRLANEKNREESKRDAAIQQEIMDQREERFDSYIGQIGQIASATQSLGKAVTSAYEAMGGSSEKAKKAEGAFVVAYSSVMAALELAESIRAFAKQDYVSGALHLVGMAAYIAAAVEAGSQLGGGAAKTPSAQTTYTPARTEGLNSPAGESGGTTVVNQYSWGRSRAEAAVAVADIEYEGARTGRVRRSDASVWGA